MLNKILDDQMKWAERGVIILNESNKIKHDQKLNFAFVLNHVCDVKNFHQSENPNQWHPNRHPNP